QQTLPPGSPLATNDSERWLSRWGLTIGELNRELLADVERRLRIGDSGQPLAASTAGRFRKVARSCVGRAAELKNLPDPWPPSPKGRGRRKARRQRRAVDVRLLPDPMSMLRIIEAMASHQPGSRIYQTMTAVTYYAGLRPSEVLYLRPQALELPATGWGTIHVVEADDGYDQAAEPKTGSRDVPIEPDLVIILRRWVEQHRLARAELLFRTRTGKRPTMSNWGRSLKRACRKVGHRMLTPYDARHACATSWLRAGVPLGTAACRLGHSVETLVSTYVGALEGDDVVANDRIVVARDAARSQLAQGVTSVLAVCWTLPRPSHARPTDKG
ncbi:MAG: tyrosine-type recombinase/integrase, partial [Acidimicrobiales bacterium]